MIGKKEIIAEFKFRVFDESYERIYKCLRILDEEQLWESPNGSIPSVGCLMLHLCGNARQWILSGLGGKKDNRNRDDEFVIHRNIRKSDFIFLLENMKSQLIDCFEEMDDYLISERFNVQGFDVSGYSAISHVLEHFSYHTGQITTLTKLYANKQTNYYSGLDLNVNNRLN